MTSFFFRLVFVIFSLMDIVSIAQENKGPAQPAVAPVTPNAGAPLVLPIQNQPQKLSTSARLEKQENSKNKSEIKKAVLDFEWEKVEEASGYEVKLQKKDLIDPAISVQTEENRFNKELPLGIYLIQIRSKEKGTGYYGQWSAPIELEVGPKVVELLEPKENETLAVPNTKELKVIFKWKSFRSTKLYKLRIWNQDPAQAKEYLTADTQYEVSLKAGESYQWQVTIEDENSFEFLANVGTRAFSIIGEQVNKPVLAKLINENNAIEVSWKLSLDGKMYDILVEKKFLDDEKWKIVATKKALEKKYVTMEQLEPADYKVTVIGKAPQKIDSEPGFLEFTVKPTKERVQDLIKSLKLAR